MFFYVLFVLFLNSVCPEDAGKVIKYNKIFFLIKEYILKKYFLFYTSFGENSNFLITSDYFGFIIDIFFVG